MAMPKSTPTRVVETITNTTGIPTSYTHTHVLQSEHVRVSWCTCDVGIPVVFVTIPTTLVGVLFGNNSIVFLYLYKETFIKDFD